jgi:hypothetical protein
MPTWTTDFESLQSFLQFLVIMFRGLFSDEVKPGVGYVGTTLGEVCISDLFLVLS